MTGRFPIDSRPLVGPAAGMETRMDWKYACPGMPIQDLDTPSLLLDLDALDSNIERMAKFFASRPARLRPHTKTHKTPIIAHRQIAAGAVGVCCQKVGEAEVMAAGGVRDILVSNEVVGPLKIERLMSLAPHCDLKVVVDDPENARALSEAALRKGLVLEVLIEVNVGQDRCGVAPGPPALHLAEAIARCRGLRLRGLQGYEGFLMLVKEFASRREQVQVAMQKLLETRDLLVKAGHPVEILTGGGTGTYQLTGATPGITEVQAGSYVVMDSSYRDVEGVDFEVALTVLATVMSRPTRDRAVVDAGFKTLSTDQGMPCVKDVRGAEYYPGGDEHGRLRLQDPSRDLRVGDQVEIIPSHCDTTINLHDEYFCHRNGRLEAVWPIAARGRIR